MIRYVLYKSFVLASKKKKHSKKTAPETNRHGNRRRGRKPHKSSQPKGVNNSGTEFHDKHTCSKNKEITVKALDK